MSNTKVFYVEDELFLARIVKESLESRDFEVIMEHDGAKAVNLFKRTRIHNLLRLNKEGVKKITTDSVKIGKYNFQINRQVLRSDKEQRKLSFRESELLKVLYESRDRVIDRKDILNLLWGNDSFFNSRNLDVYITKLRSYLKDDPSLEIITIKGIGYRFVVS